MAEYFYLPVFTDAVMADLGHLADNEFGAYFRLQILIWRSAECRVPNDDAWLMRRLMRSESEIRGLYRPLIEEFFDCDGNWITNPLLLKQRDYIREQKRRQSERSKSRWRKVKGRSHCNTAAAVQSKSIPLSKPKSKKSDKNIVISDDAIKEAEEYAYDQDILELKKQFIDFVRAHKIPHNPDKAFVAWVKKFMAKLRPYDPTD